MNEFLKRFSGDFSGDKVRELLREGRSNELSVQFLRIIRIFSALTRLESDERLFLNYFMEIFLEIFTNQTFIVPEEHKKYYIRMQSFIGKFAALTQLKTTDKYLLRLTGSTGSVRNYLDRANLHKILTLFSCRNETVPDYPLIFFGDAAMASLWYWEYYQFIDYVNPLTLNNLKRHIEALGTIGNRLNSALGPQYISGFFLPTYIDPLLERKVKEKVNFLSKRASALIKIENKPARGKIAIISKYFNLPLHSVFRGTGQFIEALAGDYELTLVHLGNNRAGTFPPYFKKVVLLNLDVVDNILDISPLQNNDFSMVIYPDIGLTEESIFLSNLRLAPVQVTCHGHSVSTFGAETDYFISGEAAEAPDGAKFYSEKLVLIPGTGLCQSYPDYQPRNPQKGSEDFFITCPWSLAKINYEHLLVLQEILKKTDKKIVFQFFSSAYDIYYHVLAGEIGGVLGKEHTKVFNYITYEDYMQEFEKSELSLDSFHFGGYNSVFDALVLKKPLVAWEGERAYNRFAPALLKKAGLDELVAGSRAEFISTSLRLINDDAYRLALAGRIGRLDVPGLITNEITYFKKAIGFIMENHEKLKAQPGPFLIR